MRRATFPYVRHDREDGMQMQQYPPFMPQQQQYQYNGLNGGPPRRLHLVLAALPVHRLRARDQA